MAFPNHYGLSAMPTTTSTLAQSFATGLQRIKMCTEGAGVHEAGEGGDTDILYSNDRAESSGH